MIGASATAPLRGARAAFLFLTRIPVGGGPYRDVDWQWATAWFPFVGACVGLMMAGVWILLAGAGPWVAASLVLGFGMLVTGAFHEDGLADTADALGGALDREGIMRILKDSRIGTFGAAALVISILARAACLARLEGEAPAALVATQCLSRLAPVWLVVSLPYVTRTAESKSRQVVRATTTQGLAATLWPVLVLAALVVNGWMALLPALAIAAACPVTGLVCGWVFRSRAGGVTGDFLGATQQVGEVAMLVVLAFMGARA